MLGDDVYDLTATGRAELATLEAFLRACDAIAGPVSAWLGARMAGLPPLCSYRSLEREPDPGLRHLLKPLDTQEVWAAGVTYYRSRTAREEESKGSGVYDRVYLADRPEIFLKATPNRTVGPFEAVRVRSDSRWCVPEAELALVLSPQLRLVGYTAGNDVSARDIEGENPLYLPQAKIYAACCAVGPCITLREEFESGQPARITCTVRRHGTIAFQGQTRTDQIKRELDVLIAYLGRDNIFATGVALLTGTGIVPPDEFCLRAGDRVEISIERIGSLCNPVVRAQGRGG